MTTKVAFLFPGQGSQAVGMGADIYATSEAAKRVFHAFDDALGFSLSELCFQGPEETLRSTINAQPAIVAVSLAYLAAFQEALSPTTRSSWSSPLLPSYTAGHSVGEYTALVPAGVVDLKGVAWLVRERGRLMHEEENACPGSMAAVIGMDADILQAICQEASEQSKAELSTARQHVGEGEVIIANYNAPGQIVISGALRALEIASALAVERGAKRVIPLSVSGAFHSPVMTPAVNKLADATANLEMHNAQIPVIGNIHAAPLSNAEDLRHELAQQVASSVQWIRTIEYLQDAGVSVFLEIGPGKALAGMIKRIVKNVTILNINSIADIEKAATFVREAGLLTP